MSNITNNNVVNSLQMLRIHVAPVGFEIDRIVLSAIRLKADRVWLITHNEPHNDKGDKFVPKKPIVKLLNVSLKI